MKKKTLALCFIFTMLFTMPGCGGTQDAATASGSLDDSAGTQQAAQTDTAQNDEAAAEAADSQSAGTEEGTADDAPVVSGDAAAKNAFVIWAWNDDFVTLENLILEDHPELKDRLVFVNVGNNSIYQDKIDEALSDEENELYPDLMLLEVDYVKKYVNSDVLLDVADLGITKEDMADMYDYNVQLGTDSTGAVRALFWQATPGSFQVRADLAEKYLGTTDPDELYEKCFSSYEKILETAKAVAEASGGKTKLLSGYTELYRVFTNSSRAVGWYDGNDVICVDDSMYEYMELAKEMYEQELTYNSDQWDTTWYSNMAGDGETTEAAIAYCGCPWFTYYCLDAAWTANTILVKAPAEFYWGGTGLAATSGCSDRDTAALILKACTCDAAFMTRINHANGDYVNNRQVIDSLLSDETSRKESNSEMMYGDQHLIEFYRDAADTIDASAVTDIDQTTMELFNAQATAYAMGQKDLETAIADFKASVHDTYSYLKAE